MKFIPQPTDFRNTLKGTPKTSNWLPYVSFFESQLIEGQDSDGCEFFTTQESFDAQMNFLIDTGVIPASLVATFTSLGYMDAGTDGKLHFHSSPRFLQVQSGAGFNGASVQEGWTVIRQFGCLPWKDCPVDNTLTPEMYLYPISQALLDKALQFLALIGGKTAVSYQWIADGVENIVAMENAIGQAPLCFGVVTDSGWNQQYPVPPPSGKDPNHAVMCYAVKANDFSIYDHYQPASKELVNYPVIYAFQGILSYTLPAMQALVTQTAEVVSEIPSAPAAEQPLFIQEAEKVVQEIINII